MEKQLAALQEANFQLKANNTKATHEVLRLEKVPIRRSRTLQGPPLRRIQRSGGLRGPTRWSSMCPWLAFVPESDSTVAGVLGLDPTD
eukprot:7088060-Pyramimonas_sp.AAC.1